jgi:hypothetical protein
MPMGVTQPNPVMTTRRGRAKFFNMRGSIFRREARF